MCLGRFLALFSSPLLVSFFFLCFLAMPCLWASLVVKIEGCEDQNRILYFYIRQTLPKEVRYWNWNQEQYITK